MLKASWFVLFLMVGLPTASFAEEWDEVLSIQPAQSVGVAERYPFGKHGRSAALRGHTEALVARIDQEVMLLRAELARQNGDYNQVRAYIVELEQAPIPVAFQVRLNKLKHYLITRKSTRSSSLSSSVKGIVPLGVNLDDQHAVIAIVLPLTGPYEIAGNKLLQSITTGLESNGFKGSLALFDTNLYTSMFELWEVVKYYEPSFIFGPLQKKLVTDWHQLGTGIPSLYFNSIDKLYGYERSLTPNKQKGLSQVFSVLDANAYLDILVLSDQTKASKKLESEFYQAWVSRGSQGAYLGMVLEGAISRGFAEAMNVKRSQSRRLWLQNLIDVPLSYTPYARSDIDVVISFLPDREGMLIAPLLRFYGLSDVGHVWYPSSIPKHFFSKEDALLWRNTYTLVPDYIVPNGVHNERDAVDEEKSGLFYALGQVAVEIVKNPRISEATDSSVETKFGQLVSNSTGKLYLLPSIYWVDQGEFKKLTEVSDELSL